MLDIDFSAVEDTQSFDVLMPGDYPMICDEAELKDTKAGTGQYVKCKFRIFAGEGKDRVVFHNFNVKNPNAKAVEIGLGQLKSYIKASQCGVDRLTDVNDLVGYKVTGRLKIRESDEYGKQNEISNFKPFTGSLEEEDNSDVPF